MCLAVHVSLSRSLSLSLLPPASTNAVAKNVYLLSHLRHFCNSEACNTFFHAHIRSRINYVSNVCDGCSDVHIKKLKAVHKRAVKVLCASSPMLTGRGRISYGSLPLKGHLQCNKCILVHKVIHNKSPNIWDSLSALERATTIVHGTAFLFCPKQELTFIRWVLLILDPFVGMRYLEVLKQHAQWAHSNLNLFKIFVLNVTYTFSVLNRTVYSFLMFDTPGVLCVYV